MVLHEVNALLRQLFTGFTIVYDDGHLVFHWRHGGETSLMYQWTDNQ